MEFTAKQIAQLLQGKVEGNPDAVVTKLSKIEEGVSGSLSFLSNPLYTPYLYSTDATLVIVNENFVAEHPIKETCTLIRVADARVAFSQLLEMYQQAKQSKTGIEQPSFISESAMIGKEVFIGAFSYIGSNVRIGNNVKLFPHVFVGDNSVISDNTTIYAEVKLYSDSVIGRNCIIHSGVVIGSDGFGFVANNGNQQKMPQLGNVIIEDDVEIGANTTIDRATLGSTFIRKGVKLDNLIQIGHNAEIGENTVIAAQTGVAGSTKVGKNCMIGGQVGIIGHLTIADGVKIAAQSGVISSIAQEGAMVQGSPAFGVSEYRRSYVLFKNFTDVTNRIKLIEDILKVQKATIEQ